MSNYGLMARVKVARPIGGRLQSLIDGLSRCMASPPGGECA